MHLQTFLHDSERNTIDAMLDAELPDVNEPAEVVNDRPTWACVAWSDPGHDWMECQPCVVAYTKNQKKS